MNNKKSTEARHECHVRGGTSVTLNDAEQPERQKNDEILNLKGKAVGSLTALFLLVK